MKVVHLNNWLLAPIKQDGENFLPSAPELSPFLLFC